MIILNSFKELNLNYALRETTFQSELPISYGIVSKTQLRKLQISLNR